MRLALQRASGDCGIAALATLLGQSYEDVYAAMAPIEPTARGKSGLQWHQIRRAAKALGVSMRLKARPDLDADEGLLAVRWRKPHRHPFDWHLVVLDGRGGIVDPADGEIQPADDYLVAYRATAGRLLEAQ